MKKNIKYIVIFLMIILVIIIALLIKYKKEKQVVSKENTVVEQIENEENILVIGLEKNENEQQVIEEEIVQEPMLEPVKDAATLTQEIYNMNSPIGTLYIPKTKLTTQIYSSVNVDKMEKIPCFLYTTGGLNTTGVTLFVGHNRRNGKIFSNNNKLVEGDEFYFTDYEGTELKYTIYSKFITTDDDVSFLNSNVDSPTIALSCCTDANDENRIIILGRADL